MKKKGIAYLQNGPQPQNENPKNPYGEWLKTPGDIDFVNNGHGATHTIYGLYAMGGCNSGDGNQFGSREVAKALLGPGSYYVVTANREGIIVVAPKFGLAAFYYDG
ncbi:MAG: hypothetical protein M3R64_02980 [Pseudomonadota bacterium]|nr:hypothetical protein [Pseudomonadota bacterium]